MIAVPAAGDRLARHGFWLWAAAAYNAAWGGVTLLAPNLFFDVAGIARPNYPAIWQVVGLFVLLYAPAYAAAALAPSRARLLVGIAFCGKMAGPLGFLAGWLGGSLPIEFGWMVLFNDLVWLPFFALFARDILRTTDKV